MAGAKPRGAVPGVVGGGGTWGANWSACGVPKL